MSLLSDSKYGWDIKGNVMRLTLLKGGIYPDPDADRGRHRFSPMRSTPTPATGGPPRRYGGPTSSTCPSFPPPPARRKPLAMARHCPPAFSLVSADAPNLIIETVKKAEDDDALIVRLYEAYGQRGQAALTFGRPVKSAVEVNLMEQETEETKANAIAVNGQTVAFSYTPYEIKTLKVQM